MRAILLTFDSPGGQVNGVAELAAAIRATGARKPVEAYVSNDANSAAYWLASAAQRITVADTATLGSIGVRMGLTDTSEQDARRGIKRIEFISSQSPDKVPDLATSEGKAKVQKIVDDLADVFVGAVAENRGVAKETVINRYGRGGIEIGAQAVKLGMADALGSFEGTLERLAAGSGIRAQWRGSKPMTDQPVHTQAAFDAAVNNARAEGERAGATASQTRIRAILAHDEAKDRRTTAEHIAFNTSMSADDAVGMLKATAKEAAPVAAVAPPAPAPATGARAKDVAGGLVMADRVQDEQKTEAKQPVTIDTRAVYKKFEGQG